MWSADFHGCLWFALQRYLSKTGTVVADGIWMDAIKTHAYVTFETTEQAIATRLAIYGRQWPEVHGKVLTVEFSTETATEHEAALKQEEEQKLKAMAAAKLAAERRRQQREADLQAAREKREAEGAARRAEAAAAEPVPDPLAPEPGTKRTYYHCFVSQQCNNVSYIRVCVMFCSQNTRHIVPRHSD